MFKYFKSSSSVWTFVSVSNNDIVSASNDKTIKIWYFKKAICLNTLEGHEDFVSCLSISNDNKFIVSGVLIILSKYGILKMVIV